MLTVPRTKDISSLVRGNVQTGATQKIPAYYSSFSPTKMEETDKIIESRLKYNQELESFEAKQSVNEFEKRHFGIKNSPEIQKPKLDSSTRDKICFIEIENMGTRKIRGLSQSQPVSAKVSPRDIVIELENTPWQALDDPTFISTDDLKQVTKMNVNQHPFYSNFASDAKGIPVFSAAERRNHVAKVEKYRQDMFTQLTLDRTRRENMLRKKALTALESTKAQKDANDKKYIIAGQQWCLEELEKRRKLRNMKPVKEEKIDPLAIEAIQDVDKKEELIKERMKSVTVKKM